MCMPNSIIVKGKLILRIIGFTTSDIYCSFFFLWLKQKDTWKEQKSQYFYLTVLLKKYILVHRSAGNEIELHGKQVF